MLRFQFYVIHTKSQWDSIFVQYKEIREFEIPNHVNYILDFLFFVGTLHMYIS